MNQRDLDRHRDPVLPIRPFGAGGPTFGPVIVSVAQVGDRRVTEVRRGDGTTFTVTVPPGGMDRPHDPHERTAPWIREDRGGRSAPYAALDGLAARVGLHLVSDRSAGSPED
jgi:hypothetical protein